MRKLASIKTISNITPIKDKDKIVLATVDGWSVIVKKDEYKIGDKCVYVEIDSVLPEKPEFEFLRKNNFRIKTMRMAGCISQGICFPLSILPVKTQGEYEVEEDVTDLIGIKQYEATMDTDPNTNVNSTENKHLCFLRHIPLIRRLVSSKQKDKSFPSFIHKTDEVRIQNIPYILQDKRRWIATEKIDGCSGTYALVRHKSKIPFAKDRFEYIVCSRNNRLWEKDTSVYWKVSDKYNIKKCLREMIENRDWIAIQGECISPKVQGNKYKVNDVDFYVFNLIDTNGRYNSLEAKYTCDKYKIKFVPIIATQYTLPDTVDEVLKYAHGESQLVDGLREGIVFRSWDGKLSFKAVDPYFLLKHNE